MVNNVESLAASSMDYEIRRKLLTSNGELKNHREQNYFLFLVTLTSRELSKFRLRPHSKTLSKFTAVE
jgi:hypothetical protein